MLPEALLMLLLITVLTVEVSDLHLKLVWLRTSKFCMKLVGIKSSLASWVVSFLISF